MEYKVKLTTTTINGNNENVVFYDFYNNLEDALKAVERGNNNKKHYLKVELVGA